MGKDGILRGRKSRVPSRLSLSGPGDHAANACPIPLLGKSAPEEERSHGQPGAIFLLPLVAAFPAKRHIHCQVPNRSHRLIMTRNLRVAAAQVGRIDRGTNKQEVVARLMMLLEDAASKDVKLAVFPETTFSK
jgi:hypothetical protein